MGFKLNTFCICGKRLRARPQGPYGSEQTHQGKYKNKLSGFFLQINPPDIL